MDERRAAELIARVDWSKLSSDAVETLRRIVVALAAGLSYQEIADQLDEREEIHRRRKRLRSELGRMMHEGSP